MQEIEGRVQDIRTRSYSRLIEALQHDWKSIAAKTHKLMPVLLCKSQKNRLLLVVAYALVQVPRATAILQYKDLAHVRPQRFRLG